MKALTSHTLITLALIAATVILFVYNKDEIAWCAAVVTGVVLFTGKD